LVLDEVNRASFALQNLALKPTSHSLTILATSYSSVSIGSSEKNLVQLPFHRLLTHILTASQ